MIVLFEIRAKLTELYQKYSFGILTACKFFLLFFAFSEIKSSVGYFEALSKNSVIFLLSVLCSLLPSALTVLIVLFYLVLQLWKASYLMSLTVLVVCLILYCFFLRYTPRYGSVVVAMPLLRKIGFPYLLPLSMGLFGNLFTIIPTCCGVFVYYLIAIIRENIVTLQQMADADNPLVMYMEVIDKLVKNPAMYLTMFLYALVIVVVYFVRRLNMDYAFEISVGVGTGVMILGYIIGTLKYDMGVSLVSVLLSSLVSALLVYLFLFAYRVLRYAAAENVQFEDDDYYYYVRAVPKIKADMPKRTVKKVITRTVASFEEEDEEEEEGLEDALEEIGKATSARDMERPLRPRPAQPQGTQNAQKAPSPSAQSQPPVRKPQPAGTPLYEEDEDDEDDYK